MPKPFTAILIDDEPAARDILMLHMERIPSIQVVGQFKNAIEALSFMKANAVDVVFLDINMPEVSGLSFGKLIQAETKLIFTTAHREYAVEGFDLQAVDYLLKPISFERLDQAVFKLTGEISKDRPDTEVKTDEGVATFVFVRSDRKMIKIDFDQILYVESLSDYIKIHTTSATVVTRETISNFEGKLPHDHFIRVHRSFIVRLDSVQSYTSEELQVHKKSIPISRSYRTEVIGRLERFS